MGNGPKSPERTTVALIVPPGMLADDDIATLSSHSNLDVHVVTYEDPPAVRQARREGTLTPEIAAQCPALTATEEAVLARCEVAIARDLPLNLSQRAPRLRWVQAVGAGIEQLDPGGLADIGIVLTNASGVAAQPISEFVMAQLLSLWKDLREFDKQQQGKVWQRRHTHLVAGKTLGVVGLGAIGRATAVRARAFDMRVIATSRTGTADRVDPDVDAFVALDQLETLLEQSDAVIASLPSTPATYQLFNAERFRAFRPGAIFCNVSRGAIVDEAALVDALDQGQPGYAVLDVTAVEPNPPTSNLWHHPRVLLSPHASTSMEGYGARLVALFLKNVARWHESGGDPQSLMNVVDPALGY